MGYGYYDKDGSPMTLEQWSDKFNDNGYKRVARTTLPNGAEISTIWLGLDHQFSDGPPLIFETMVFSEDESNGDTERYTLLEEAVEGHKAMVLKWNNGNPA